MEAKEVVEKLNDQYFGEVGSEDYLIFKYGSDGTTEWVDFMDFTIWDSENDPRGWIDDNEQESLMVYVQRESRRFMVDLNSKMFLI